MELIYGSFMGRILGVEKMQPMTLIVPVEIERLDATEGIGLPGKVLLPEDIRTGCLVY